MKFHTMIEKAADLTKSILSPAMKAIALEGNELKATDGFIAARVPVPPAIDEHRERVLIDAQMLKKARGSKRKNPAELDIDQPDNLADRETWVESFDDVWDRTNPKDGKEWKYIFTLNAEFLHRLAQAVTEQDDCRVKVYVHPDEPNNHAIKVVSLTTGNETHEHGEGRIMPVIVPLDNEIRVTVANEPKERKPIYDDTSQSTERRGEEATTSASRTSNSQAETRSPASAHARG